MKHFVYFGLLLLSLTACSRSTPEMRGVVLDEKTGQPVENAWITSTLSLKTKTIQGDVHSYQAVDPPHTRTDKNGRFVIPARKFKTPPFPVGLGTEVESLSINASTIDDRSGGFAVKDYEKPQLDLTVYVSPWKKGLEDDREYSSYLQSLYKYCTTGRFGIEAPRGVQGCDAWELDLAIAQHEGFVKRLGEAKTGDQQTSLWGTRKQLAYLYGRKGEYKKALDIFIALKSSDERRGSKMWLKEYETQINELEQELNAR